MKKGFAILVVLLLLSGCAPAPALQDGTAETKAGSVVDLAMNDGFPYVGIEFEDGSADCFYGLTKNAIPDGIAVGDKVELTYGLDERTNRWFVIELREME